MKLNPETRILKGITEKARYKKQELKEYEGNPFIEALPSIFTEEDVLESLMIETVITEEDKCRPNHLRLHVINRIRSFMLPLPIHFAIEAKISGLIRRSYLGRNPLDKAYRKQQAEFNKEKDIEVVQHSRSTADGLTLIGISGTGKSTAVEKLLLMYPQVIEHSKYGNNLFTRKQIVWLKIDCPYDGNIKTLYKSFFKAIDDMLGTEYLKKYGYKNKSSSTLMLYMTKLASLYGIGVLVIDEIQHLLNQKSDREQMLNFFVTLSNTVGISTILIGTPKAQELFEGNLRQVRRATSEGAIIWDRMKEGSSEWEFFLEALWGKKCLKENTPLTPKIKQVFYEETQGIIAIAVNLFIMIQERALVEGTECITASLIRKTSQEDMQIIQPIIKAIRANNISEMKRYDDISIQLVKIESNPVKAIEIANRLEDLYRERHTEANKRREDYKENLTLDMIQMGIFTELDYDKVSKIVSKILESTPVDGSYEKLKMLVLKECMKRNEEYLTKKDDKRVIRGAQNGLLEIYNVARDKKLNPYEVLKQKGYIQDPLIEFKEVN